MKRSHGWVASGIILLALVITPARADVLEQVPADALLVIKAGNLQATSQKVAALAQQFGLVAMAPQMADPLGWLMQTAGVNAGLKKDGDLAIVMFSPKAENLDPDKSLMILVPVTDYKAFIGNFKDAKKDGAFDVIRLPNDNDDTLVADWHGYAALVPSKAILSKKPGGLKLAGETGKIIQDKSVDVTAWVNMQIIKSIVQPPIAAERKQWVDDAIAQYKAGNGMPKYESLIKLLLERGIDLMNEGVASAQAATFSIALSKEGINTTFMAEFLPDTEFGKNIAQVKNSNGSLLTGLPEEDYIFYGGFVHDPALTEKLLSSLDEPLKKELENLGDDGKKILAALDAMHSTLKAIKGGDFGIVLDPNGGAAGMVKGVTVIDGDAKAIMAGQAKSRTAMQDIMQLMPGAKQKLTVTPAAKTVDGVKFDLVQSTIQADPKKPEEMMAQQMMNIIYGPKGTQAFMGVADDSHVLQIMGEDEKLMSDAITAAKAGTDTLSQQVQVKDVVDKLPKERFTAGYFAIDKAVTGGIKIANMQLGQNIQLQLPPNLPPLGFTYATKGTAVRIDGHLPSQTIQAITAASMQAMMQARPRGGGGKPGDL